jgi:hypothetical protein
MSTATALARPVTADRAVDAVWRASRRRDWQSVEIVDGHPSGQVVLREVGRLWPGVFLAPRDQVRIAGPEFVPGVPCAVGQVRS